jgi:hypothetical protein
MVVLVVIWALAALKLDIPAEIATAIGGLVVTGVNIGMRILHKKGLL